MSLNLLSKSEFEKKKNTTNSRLGQVVATLMTPRFGAAAAGAPVGAGSGSCNVPHVDLGELSAVGELLALPEWRSSLVRLFGVTLGLDQESAPHLQLPTSAFLSLSLLFNIALEECSTDADYANALALLHYSGKIYNLPGIESMEQMQAIAAAAAAAATASSSPFAAASIAKPAATKPSAAPLEREYLRLVLRRQALWQQTDFWLVAYRIDIQTKLDNPSLPSTPHSYSGGPSSASAPDASDKSVSAAVQQSPSVGAGSSTSMLHLDNNNDPRAIESLSSESRESTVFELLAGLIYLHLSLGAAAEAVRGVVAHTATHFNLSAEKQHTLHTLVANIARSTQASVQSAATYTPHTNTRPLQHPRPQGSHTPNSHTLQYPTDDED